MRNTWILFGLLFTTAVGCKQDRQAWADYNNRVVKEVKAADSTIEQLFSFKDFETYPTAKESYTTALNGIRGRLEGIAAPGADDSLRLAALELTSVYIEIAQSDFNTIYVLMHDSIYTPADSASVDSLSDTMYAKWQAASGKFAALQQDFGVKYDIRLE